MAAMHHGQRCGRRWSPSRPSNRRRWSRSWTGPASPCPASRTRESRIRGTHDHAHREREETAGRRPTRHAPPLGHPRKAQSHRDEVRLRCCRLRRLYRARGRLARALLRHHDGRGVGQEDHHHRGALRQERSSCPEGVDRARRAPVRLLPVGADPLGGGAARPEGHTDGHGHRRCHGGQHLPLRDVPADPRGHPPRRADQEGRRMMATLRTAQAGISRRALIKGGLAVGTGLVVGFRLPVTGRGTALAQATGVFAPNQWIKIDRDGLVTIVNSVPEMGQGSLTTMPAIVADELDTDLGKVKVEQAPANPALYANPVTKSQSYGGSRGVRDHIQMWRKSAAAAREMLKQAAANEWGVPVEQVTTEPDVVVHKPSGRRLPYAQLVDKASQLPVPQEPKLKTPDQFRYIGKMVKRRDTPEKINGKGVYGMDVVLPGMLIASVERCPVNNGKVKSFDATATKQIKGVKDVV